MKYLIILIALALTGCASDDYTQYAKAQSDIATARANYDAARYQALASIASKGDSASGVAAVMAIALGSGSQQGQQQVAAPQRSDALQWAAILVPGLTQAYAIAKSADVAINSSNNAYLTSAATTSAFVGIAGKIQAPGAITTTTDRHDTVTTLSGTGTLGSGAYSITDDHTTTPAPVVITPVTPTVPVVVVPDTVVNQPVIVPDVVQITPTVITPVTVPDVIQIVPVMP